MKKTKHRPSTVISNQWMMPIADPCLILAEDNNTDFIVVKK